MMPLEIAPKIYDVGVVDWAVRDFHGYKTAVSYTHLTLPTTPYV